MFYFLYLFSIYDNYSISNYSLLNYNQDTSNIYNNLKKIFEKRQYIETNEIFYLLFAFIVLMYNIWYFVFIFLMSALLINNNQKVYDLLTSGVINILELSHNILELRQNRDEGYIPLNYTSYFTYSYSYLTYICIISSFVKLISYLPDDIKNIKTTYSVPFVQFNITDILNSIINWYNNYIKSLQCNDYIKSIQGNDIFKTIILINDILFDILIVYTNNVVLVLISMLPEILNNWENNDILLIFIFYILLKQIPFLMSVYPFIDNYFVMSILFFTFPQYRKFYMIFASIMGKNLFPFVIMNKKYLTYLLTGIFWYISNFSSWNISPFGIQKKTIIESYKYIVEQMQTYQDMPIMNFIKLLTSLFEDKK